MKIKTKDGSEVEVMEAEILWAEQHAESIVEDELQEIFDGTWEEIKAKNYKLAFHSIGVDSYDSSIELYVSEDAVFDWALLGAALKEFGFTYGWINFDDGSEIHFNLGQHYIIYPREKKAHPHYTKEMRDRDDKGLGDRPAFRRFLKQERESK